MTDRLTNKAKIVCTNGVYRYFDRNGAELFDGDTVRYASGATKLLYKTESGELGTDATNPKWIEQGRAAPCEYGIYPLNFDEVSEIEKCN